jgi:hypothetical protein
MHPKFYRENLKWKDLIEKLRCRCENNIKVSPKELIVEMWPGSRFSEYIVQQKCRFNVLLTVHRNISVQWNQKDALFSVYYHLTASTCFEHYLLNFRRRFINNNWCILCVLCRLAATTVGVDITRTKYTNYCLRSASWRWTSSARNMYRLLIRNNLTTKSASCWFYYTAKCRCRVVTCSMKLEGSVK